MPRVIVTTDQCKRPDDDSVLLDERVGSVNLSSEHAVAQLVQRIAWAVSDAEGVEHTQALGRQLADAERAASANGDPLTRSYPLDGAALVIPDISQTCEQAS